MKQKQNRWIIIGLLCFLMLISVSVSADDSQLERLLNFKVVPLSALDIDSSKMNIEEGEPIYWNLGLAKPFTEPGEALLKLTVNVDTAYFNSSKSSSNLNIKIETKGGLETLSDPVFIMHRGNKPTHSELLRVNVPDDTISSFSVLLRYDSKESFHWITTITFACKDGVGFCRGQNIHPTEEENNYYNPPDTALYLVRHDLSDPERMHDVRTHLERLGRSLIPTEDSNIYIVGTTQRQLDRMESEGRRYELIDIPPLWQDTNLYDILINLMVPEQYHLVSELADSLGRALVPDRESGYYILKINRHKANWFKMNGISFTFRKNLPLLPIDSIRIERKREFDAMQPPKL